MKPIPSRCLPSLTALAVLLATLGLAAPRAAGAQDRGASTQPMDQSAADQSPAGPDTAKRLPTLPVAQIHRGQTGYGLTVFTGDEPERFDAEVLGVLRNTDPKMTYVLARLSGHGLEKSGVIQGMSGSPVFIDGRLVGAVAFAWPFATEAIAGITPIEAMRSIQELPSGIPAPPERMPMPSPSRDAEAAGSTGMAGMAGAAGAGTVPDLASLANPHGLAAKGGGSGGVRGERPEDLLERTLATLRPQITGVAPGAIPAVGWVTSGFGERSRGVLEAALGDVAPTGTATAEETAPLQTGGPVAAVLVAGDLQLAATGTVTERHGDEVLAFGHSFLGLGPLSVPMASSEIVTILPSRYNSFKISNLGPVVGAFEQDAQSGIRGQIGADAPMIPYTLRVHGLRDREFHMRLAALPQLVPALVAAATVGGLDSATFSGGPQGIDLNATFHLKDWGDLVVQQSFDGPDAANAASAHLVSTASFLVQNPYREVTITGMDVDLEQTARPRLATLVAAHADRTVVRPGDKVELTLELKGYRGALFRRSAEVRIPEDASAGSLFLMVGDGSSADAARLALEPTDPVTFGQALGLLRSFHSNRELVVLQVVRASGLSVAGNTLPQLPGSVQSIWKAASSASSKPLALAVTQTEVGELPFPAEGLVRIDLEVRRREPMSGEPGETEGAGPSGETGEAGAAGQSAEPVGAGESGPPSRVSDEQQTGAVAGVTAPREEM